MLQSDLLSDLKPVRHSFFTREGGVSSGLYASLNCGFGSHDEARSVAENRRRAAERLAPEATLPNTPRQTHSARVFTATGPWSPTQPPDADAVVTTTPGLTIGVLTADCAPVLLADAGSGVVAAVHCGWRGTLAGILENTLAQMETLGADRSHIRAAVGPTISPDAYEVGPEFLEQFLAEDEQNRTYFSEGERPDHPMFDLPRFVTARLTGAGVGEVGDLGACTYARPDRFFSYRRSVHQGEPDYGRQISAIVLGS